MLLNPHLLHALSYLILTLVVLKVGYRMFLARKMSRLSSQAPVLLGTRDRLVELAELEAIKISLTEAVLVVLAHFILIAASFMEYSSSLIEAHVK